VNNLYGVDIMEEATEICKLRLFLKLVSQVEADTKKQNYGIEPLPDIDFNIRSGNTLVGFANYEEVRRAIGGDTQKALDLYSDMDNIEARAQKVANSFQLFQLMQTRLGLRAEDLRVAKADLQQNLRTLGEDLNQYLAREYGIDLTKQKDYEAWRISHRPFHWFVEFHRIITNGGFDVIIGNPPYVEYKDVSSFYTVPKFITQTCSNLFAYTLERCTDISSAVSKVGIIIPLSAFSTDRMIPLIDLLKKRSAEIRIANFSWRPGKLFDGANLQLSILIGTLGHKSYRLETTKYILWDSEARPELFTAKIRFSSVTDNRLSGSIAKLGTDEASSILSKIRLKVDEIGSCFLKNSDNKVFYRRGGLYWKVFVDFETYSSEEKAICLLPTVNRYSIIAALSSNLWFWYFTITSDCRHLGNRDITTFPLNPRKMEPSLYHKLNVLGKAYNEDIKANAMSVVRTYKGRKEVSCLSFRVKLSKPIIDEIDRVLAQHYGFTDEELDFIINYDIKYRMGKDEGEN